MFQQFKVFLAVFDYVSFIHRHFARINRFAVERRPPRRRDPHSVLEDPSWLSYYPDSRTSDERPREVKQ